MEKYIYNEKNGLLYELQGDYYISCLGMICRKKKKGVSVYGNSGLCGIASNTAGCSTPIC